MREGKRNFILVTAVRKINTKPEILFDSPFLKGQEM